jgi:hypothetical protein
MGRLCEGGHLDRRVVFSQQDVKLSDEPLTRSRLFIRNRTTPSSMNSVPAVSRQTFWICRRKKAQNLLLLPKRKRGIIPVGNLKVDSPGRPALRCLALRPLHLRRRNCRAHRRRHRRELRPCAARHAPRSNHYTPLRMTGTARYLSSQTARRGHGSWLGPFRRYHFAATNAG